jgi:hypothetical protein
MKNIETRNDEEDSDCQGCGGDDYEFDWSSLCRNG